MLNREEIFNQFSNITIHCFDLMRYKRDTDRLNFSVWLNYKDETMFSGDILVDPPSFCVFNGHEWKLIRGQDIIKVRGIQQIMDKIEENHYKNEDGTTKI